MNTNKNSNNLLLDKLICPYCCSKILKNNGGFLCQNNKCDKAFPIVNGIPVVLNEEESIFSVSDFERGKDTFFQSKELKNTTLKTRARLLIKKMVPKLSNNLSSKKNFTSVVRLLSEIDQPKTLILGGGVITSGTQMLFNENNIIIESDVSLAPRTQIIIDSHNIPYEPDTFDCIIFQAVLEHVANPYQCVAEAFRVLKKDGVVYATTPFMQQVHGGAYDFTRFTHLGHRRLFRRFKEIESGVCAGSGVSLGWSIKYFFRSLSDNKIIQNGTDIIISFLFFWLKYIDLLTKNNKSSYDSASVYYFVGRKSDDIISDKELLRQYKGNI